MKCKKSIDENEVESLLANEPELIIRSDHYTYNWHYINEVIDRLKHRSSCSSCSASIVYLFEETCFRERREVKYTTYFHLTGIVICDHNLITNDILDRLLEDYRSSEDGYWYAEDGIVVCTMSHGLVWGIKNALIEFDEMTQDPDYLKLQPYIREIVERTINNLRLVAEANDPREREQVFLKYDKIELTDFTVEL